VNFDEQKLLDSEILQKQSAAIFGAGSGGFNLATALVAAGVSKITIIDNDHVEVRNIVTSDYSLDDVSKAKVDVVCEHIKAIEPSANVTCHKAWHHELGSQKLSEIFRSHVIIVNATDDPTATQDLNRLAVLTNSDLIQFASYPGLYAYEVLGTLRHPSSVSNGCARCVAKTRFDAIEIGEIKAAKSFASHRAASSLRNAAAVYVCLGLLHYRAGSKLPIAEFGREFEKLPCWVGRAYPGVFSGECELFADVPDDLQFGMRPYREPLPEGWVCPVCGYKEIP